MRVICTAVAGLLLAGVGLASSAAPSDPFAFFRPWVQVSDTDRSRLASRDVLVRTLPAEGGHLAVFAAARLEALVREGRG